MRELPDEVVALRRRVEEALAVYLDRALPRLVALDDALKPLADELHAFVHAGGKRLRPVLALLGYQAAGGEDVEAALGPALALELLHTSALLHDDLVDAAATRRGRPSTHRRFAGQHRDAGWAGDPEHYGQAAALLLGDLAFVHADELFLDAEVEPARLRAGWRVFVRLREEVMAGQYLDLLAARRGDTSRELALTVASYKSGRYSVARPLELGAVLAGGDDDLVAGLFDLGLPLGRAFQLRDDLLGVFGTEGVTGKSAASDLAEGKRTLLVAETAARLEGRAAERFATLLGRGELTGPEVDELRELIRSSGGLEAADAALAAELDRALAVLEDLPLDGDVRHRLRATARYLVARDA